MEKDYYPKEQFWQLYKKLPSELQEAIFSEKTSESIWTICKENKIDRISDFAKYVGRVLLGLIPPRDFQKNLEEKLNLKKAEAEKIAQEVNTLIFYPLKNSLDKIYQPPHPHSPINTKDVSFGHRPSLETKPSKNGSSYKTDVYREPIE